MTGFPLKRVYGLVGAPRSGKDSVALFLKNTRGFVSFAFADQVKEEYGINKEDFEKAKESGDIERLRKELWDFSNKVKEKDPLYFIRNVMKKVSDSSDPAVITDIRTTSELDAVMNYKCNGDEIKHMYFVLKDTEKSFKNNILCESKLSKELIFNTINNRKMTKIYNNEDKLSCFFNYLGDFFAQEESRCLLRSNGWLNI